MAGCLTSTGWLPPACGQRFSVPGIERDEIYMANHSDITAYTETGNQISALTFTGATVMVKLAAHKETGSFGEELVKGTNAGSHYTQNLSMRVIDDDEATRKSIEDMVDVDLVFVVKRRNNKFYLLGRTGGITLTENPFNTGATTGDDTGDMLTFSGVNLAKMKQFFDTDAATTIVTLDSYLT
jgi:hypothetical protein